MSSNLHHIPDYRRVDFPFLQSPAVYHKGDDFLRAGWYQDGKNLHKVKPAYHFIWPKDGKRGSTWGRMKDILQNKGPDIHVTISANKGDYMHNRQRKSRWSRHTHLDWVDIPDLSMKPASWTKNPMLGGRNPSLAYDFWARKYVNPNHCVWTDAVWQGSNKNSAWPDGFRDRFGVWTQDIYGPWGG